MKRRIETHFGSTREYSTVNVQYSQVLYRSTENQSEVPPESSQMQPPTDQAFFCGLSAFNVYCILGAVELFRVLQAEKKSA